MRIQISESQFKTLSEVVKKNNKVTQTIYKNKKSTPVCPTCGTVNKD